MKKPTSRKDRKQKESKKINKVLKTIAIILLIVASGFSMYIFKIVNDVSKTTKEIHSEVREKEERRPEIVNVDSGEAPFSVLLMGIDSGDMGRNDEGRSDTMILLTVNPNEKKSTIISIPRDTYTEIVGHGTKDKINHAYAFGGPSMAINTVQNLFDIPVDYYVSVDMRGLKELINALNGIEVVPELTFTQGKYNFIKDEPITLGGAAALEYSRMRKQDPQGDYGRQKRQREIIESSINKVASFSTIMNYAEILTTLENNMSTNLTFTDMKDIFESYRDAANTIKEDQLSGVGEYINGIYYEIISDEEIARVSNVLKEQLEI